MAYIGPAPNPGQNREVDDISSSFNGSTTAFTLQVNSQNVSPGSSNAIIVSLGGVIQNPGTDYTVAASTLTFTTAPASGLSFFGLVLGQSIDTEGASDDSIGATQLQTNAVTTAKIADSTGASDGVTTAKIATSAITTAKIADQAVDLTKLPHGTGSNDGKFLRANNGADPTFETVTSTTINNNADNRLITGSGTANTLEGESSLTYSASGDLTQTVTVDGKGIVLSAGDVKPMITGNSNRSAAGNTILGVSGKWNGTEVARIAVEAGADTTNKDDGTLNFSTTTSGGSLTKRMTIDSSGHVLPGANDTYDLGSSSLRWKDIYTGDLNLSNEGKSNDVDGTWGNYTIQEGESDLFLINNRTGKKYKFNLTEVL